MDVEQQVRQFIVDNMKSSGPEVTPDYRLIDRGVLDSMAMFEVIAFIEETFGVQIEDNDLIAENFETTTAIASLVSRKTP
jgi:acyl carrier protein